MKLERKGNAVFAIIVAAALVVGSVGAFLAGRESVSRVTDSAAREPAQLVAPIGASLADERLLIDKLLSATEQTTRLQLIDSLDGLVQARQARDSELRALLIQRQDESIYAAYRAAISVYDADLVMVTGLARTGMLAEARDMEAKQGVTAENKADGATASLLDSLLAESGRTAAKPAARSTVSFLLFGMALVAVVASALFSSLRVRRDEAPPAVRETPRIRRLRRRAARARQKETVGQAVAADSSDAVMTQIVSALASIGLSCTAVRPLSSPDAETNFGASCFADPIAQPTEPRGWDAFRDYDVGLDVEP